MLRAIVDQHAGKRRQATSEAEAAEARLAQAHLKLCLSFHEHAADKAAALRRSSTLLALSMADLQARMDDQVSIATDMSSEFALLCEDVASLPDPEDWLLLTQATLVSVSNELAFVDTQLATARRSLEPA